MDKIPKTMRAVVYRGVNDLRVEQLPVPRIASSDVLVKVEACGVCPTDIKKIHYGTVSPPRVFGHETAGTIVQVGARVRGFRVGERVGLHHHVPCLKCRACERGNYAQCPLYKKTGITAGFEPAGGGYADYVRVMGFVLPGVVKIPHNNLFIEGAMQEPVNTVLKGVQKLNLRKGDVVMVAGQGPIGLMFTRLLTIEGMKVVASDLMEERLKVARTLGARWVINAGRKDFAERVRRVTGGRGLDAAVVAVPVDAVVAQAQMLVRGAGEVLLFAHTRRGEESKMDLSTICVDEKGLVGSYSSDLTLQKEVARVVFSRKLDVRKLITNEFSLEETAAAVELAAHPSPNSLKIMVIHGKK